MNCAERDVRICITIQIAVAQEHSTGDEIRYKIVNPAPGKCFSEDDGQDDFQNGDIIVEDVLLGSFETYQKRCVTVEMKNDPMIEIRATTDDGVRLHVFVFHRTLNTKRLFRHLWKN